MPKKFVVDDEDESPIETCACCGVLPANDKGFFCDDCDESTTFENTLDEDWDAFGDADELDR